MAEPLADGGEAHTSVDELRRGIEFPVTGEIRNAARRTVEAFARRGADHQKLAASVLANADVRRI